MADPESGESHRQKHSICKGQEMPREAEALEVGFSKGHKKIIREIMTVTKLRVLKKFNSQ